MRFILLCTLLVVLLMFIILSLVNASKEWSIRVGYFANKLSNTVFDASTVSSVRINTKDCVTYILENSNSNQFQIDTSAERGSSISNTLTGSELSVKVHSSSSTVQCSLEVKIPGGKSLSGLSLEFPDEISQNLILYDYKDDSTWTSPLVITNMVISVGAANPNIFFKNEHEVDSLRATGAYCVCDFQKLKIKSMNFEIVFGSLNIVQNKFYAENKITVKTPHGTHCVAGHTVNSVDTSCPDQATRDAGITSTFIDTSSYCQSELYVCSNSSSSCPASGTAASSSQGDFKLTLNDGPIQFTIDSSSTPSTSTYLPTFDTFAVTSQNRLRENKEDFSGDKNDPRMYIYELSSPSFSQTWIHLFLKQYLQARVWLISILSLNFLTPSTYKYSLIHIPNATCPSAASESLVSSTYISNKLKDLSFVEAKHVVAQLTEDDYYTYEVTEDNRFQKEPVSFLDGNIFIVACLVMMVIATVVLVLLVFWLVAHLKTVLEKRYHRMLQNARTLSKAKMTHQNDGYGLNLSGNSDTKIIMPTKVLKIGCFTSEIEEVEQVRDESYENTLREKIEAEQMIQLSFFKTLDLEVDSYFRKRRNSFQDFLNFITVDEGYFEERKEKNPEDIIAISIRLDLLHSHYLDFCTRHGLKERIITEEERVLDHFDLKILSVESSSTSAYTKIRWKTYFEKEKQERTENLSEYTSCKGSNQEDISFNNGFNVRRKFIILNCVASRLESDYILQEDLQQRYSEYCEENKIDPVMAGSILTCQELNEFGAIYKDDFKVPHIVGITRTSVDLLKINIDSSCNPNRVQSLSGLIRTKERHSSLFDIPIAGGGMYRMFTMNATRASFGRNLFQILWSLIFLFGLPLLFLLLIIWGLQQVNKTKSDIYAPTFGLSDVFSASSTNNWFDHLEFHWVFYTFLSLALLFIASGISELICFIATDGSDTGRYPVIKTMPRWIISTLFWVMLCLYIGMYVAYFGVILLWCILGAILNPQTFLPLASGAAVIIGCVIYFITVINKVNSSLDDIVHKVIEEQLQITLVNSLNNNEKISKIVEAVDDLPQTTFNTALNMFLSLNNLEKVERRVSDKILDGDVQSLAVMLESSFMIPSEISQGIIGMLIDDPLLIINSVQSYVTTKGIYDPFFINFADFLYFISTTKIKNRRETSKKVSQIVKKMIKKISPSFDLEVIDVALKIVFEQSLTPLKKIYEAEKLPVEVLNIAIAMGTNNKVDIQTNVYKLAQRLIPKKLFRLFYALNKIACKNIYGSNDHIEKVISVSPCISVELIFALFNEEEETARHAMLNGIQKFCSRKESWINVECVKSLYLGLSSIVSSDTVNLPSLARNSIIPIAIKEVELLYKATQGDRASINYICDSLKIGDNCNIIFEILNIIFEGNVNLKETCKKLEIPLEPVNEFMTLVMT